ncbi:MAG: hypothetical protein K8R60_06815 [Burkholderiales bacterium]|nr:hypothetical protein [Burkholderiales bacterium]
MSNQARHALLAIQRLSSADLAGTSDEDIRAEIAQDGMDPDALACEIAEHLDSIAAEFMRNCVASTKALKKAADVPATSHRPTLEKIKLLIQLAFEREPGLAAAFREGTKQSENDLESLFDDLVALGKIQVDLDG